MKIKRLLVLAATSFMLLACNNGGGGKNPPTPPKDDPVKWTYTLSDDGEYYIVEIEEIKATELFDMVIPSEHEGKPVKQVGYDNLLFISWVEGKEFVRSVTFPDSVTYMGGQNAQGLMPDLENLESVVLSKNCKDIPFACFSGCRKLSRVVIPEGVKTIGRGAFGNTKALESITFPSTVQTIYQEAFHDSGLKTINWATTLADDGRLQIEINAFQRCESLENVILPDYIFAYSNPYENRNWFDSCTGIKKFRMSGLIEKLYGYPFGQFGDNYQLEEYTLPKSVTTLDKRSLFFSTTKFTHITTLTYEGTKQDWLAINKNSEYLDWTLDGETYYNSALTTVHSLKDDQTFSIR